MTSQEFNPGTNRLADGERIPEHRVGAVIHAETQDPSFCCIDLYFVGIRMTVFGGVRNDPHEPECNDQISTRTPSLTSLCRMALPPQRLHREVRWRWSRPDENSISWVGIGMTSSERIRRRPATKSRCEQPSPRSTAFPLHRNRTRFVFLASGSSSLRSTIERMSTESFRNLTGRQLANTDSAPRYYRVSKTAPRFVRKRQEGYLRRPDRVLSFASSSWTDR